MSATRIFGSTAAPARRGRTQVAIAAQAGVAQRLQRRRRGAEQHRAADDLRAAHGQVAGGVAKAVLLLQRQVVLLVDDDQAEVGQRREDRRAGAQHQPRATARGLLPGEFALALAERRVQHGHGCVDATGKALAQLRRQADLRHQHQHLLSKAQRVVDQAQVDLGLAAAGDAVEQEAAEACRLAHPLHRCLLVSVEFRPVGRYLG
jgi:hypothetical protein